MVLKNNKIIPEKFHEEKEHLNSAAIIVENIENDQETELISLLFENEKKSGGGPIESYKFDKYSRELVINFKDVAIAQRVIEFGPISIANKTYRAKKYQPKGKKYLKLKQITSVLH